MSPDVRLNRGRILASAGIPSAVALVILISLLFWRLSVLQAASAREDRSDEAVVTAAVLRTSLLRLQNDERAFLLTGRDGSGQDRSLVSAIEAQFPQVRELIGDSPQDVAALETIRAQYHEWLNSSRRLNALRASRPVGAVYTARELRTDLSSAFNGEADQLVQRQHLLRLQESAATDRETETALLVTIVGSFIVAAILLLSVWRAFVDAFAERQRQLVESTRFERARESARIKSEFIAHMSHELRTPLTAILGLGEMLYDEKAGPLTPRQRRYLNDILMSGNHLLELINEVLDLSRIEAGKIEIVKRDCDPSALAREVVESLSPVAQAKNIRITEEFAGSPVTVSTDPSRFRQILYNYLSNAIKFTAKNGAVTIRILLDATGMFRLEVQDNGIGIADEDIQRLFRDFSQVDPATSDGAGLGLALTKRIVELQGGSVGVSSRKGEGSLFFATLPVGERYASSLSR